MKNQKEPQSQIMLLREEIEKVCCCMVVREGEG